MSSGYQQYGGNPYDQSPGVEGGYGQQGLYPQPSSNYSQATTPQQGYGAPNPYATTSNTAQYQQDAHSAQPFGNASAGQPGVVRVEAPPTELSNQDFLSRCDAIRGQIRELTSNIGEIGSVHQRLLSSPDSNHAQLDNLVSNTQVLNTKIQDQIRKLEADSLKSGENTTKKSQIRTLKGQFRNQLEDYQKEEQAYRKRYQDQISREYKIVNPEASDSEVREAAQADWGNEGVFQTALKSNRTGAANSALGNVRARHNDIQKIEKTLIELAQMFQDLAAQVELQEPQVTKVEEQTHDATVNTQEGNVKLDSAIKHAQTWRKLKWWVFGAVVFIIIILVAVIGGYFGYQSQHKNKKRSV